MIVGMTCKQSNGGTGALGQQKADEVQPKLCAHIPKLRIFVTKVIFEGSNSHWCCFFYIFYVVVYIAQGLSQSRKSRSECSCILYIIRASRLLYKSCLISLNTF